MEKRRHQNEKNVLGCIEADFCNQIPEIAGHQSILHTFLENSRMSDYRRKSQQFLSITNTPPSEIATQGFKRVFEEENDDFDILKKEGGPPSLSSPKCPN